MPSTKDIANNNDSFMSIAKRNDGSVRQILVEKHGEVVGRGFFPPGTFMTDEGWLNKRKFHWIDAWTDEELLDQNNELIFDEKLIAEKREESILANETKTFVIEDINTYKRKS